MIETLPTARANDSLDKGVLPRCMRGCEHFLGTATTRPDYARMATT
jgi:hypothetical protein